MGTDPEIPVIAAINQKGGCGKTEVSIILSENLVLVEEKSVLGIDLDIQANYSDHTVGMEPEKKNESGQKIPSHPDYEPGQGTNERSSIADLFFGQSVLPYQSWIQTDNTGSLDVAMANPDRLEQITDEFQRSINQPLNKDVHNALYNFLSDGENDPESTSISDLYDAVIIDTGPSRSPLFRATLRAATHVIIPFKPNRRDIQGIVSMLSAIKRENLQRPNARSPLKLIGLLPNLIENPLTISQKKYLPLVMEKHSDILMPEETWLHKHAAFTNRDLATADPRSIFELPDSSRAKQEATNLCDYIKQEIFGE
jgi:chromosome partitioning protein